MFWLDKTKCVQSFGVNHAFKTTDQQVERNLIVWGFCLFIQNSYGEMYWQLNDDKWELQLFTCQFTALKEGSPSPPPPPQLKIKKCTCVVPLKSAFFLAFCVFGSCAEH